MAAPEKGPLHGVRFVEFAGIGPVPFAGMVLAGLGAEGIRLEGPRRASSLAVAGDPVTSRGRPGIQVDLKRPEGVALAQRLVDRSDALLEGYRPGVMERLGLGPDECLVRNGRLVYGRMTGWGQDGPLAARAGHDLTYLAIAGPLRHFARQGQPPVPPLNLVADYGGGGMLLVAGVLAGLIAAGRTGRGQVVDAAMVDGSALLMASTYGLAAMGLWQGEPGTNLLDTGAPFYDVYPTKDGRYVAVAALEPPFFAALLDGLGLNDMPDQYDVSGWPVLRARFTEVFAKRTRDEWASHFEGTDACVAPVLDMTEAPDHPHLRSRGTYSTERGFVEPAAAPRFSGTPVRPAAEPEGDPLTGWGIEPDEVAVLIASGVLATSGR